MVHAGGASDEGRVAVRVSVTAREKKKRLIKRESRKRIMSDSK